jgi:ATP-dependent DNA helicase DinG
VEQGGRNVLEPFSQPLDTFTFCCGYADTRLFGPEALFAVAALRLLPGGKRERFHSLIRCNPPPARLRVASRTTSAALKAAPDREAVAENLRSFLKDPSFLLCYPGRETARELSALAGVERRVDLTFAAQYFLPFLPSSDPAPLWEHLNGRRREKTGLSVEELADLSVDLVAHICGVQLNDRLRPWAPPLRHFLGESRTLLGVALLHLCRNYGRYFGDLFTPCSVADTADWRPFLETAVRGAEPEAPRETAPRPVSLPQLADHFRALAREGGGSRYRPEQVAYAEAVARTLNAGGVLTLEAGTGTGKTRGYLVPLLAYLHGNPSQRALVSTYTKSLQEQLLRRELALLLSVFEHYRGIPVAALKGKASYVCAEKLDQAYEEGMTGPPMLSWLFALNLAFQFREADLDGVGEGVRRVLGSEGGLSRLLGEVSAKSGCTPRHRRCPAQVVAGEAYRSRLVVTNHHKLALLEQDPVLAERFSLAVIDEANHFEPAVRNALSVDVGSSDLLVAADRLVALGKSASPRRQWLARALGEAETDLQALRDGCTEVASFLRNTAPPSRKGEVRALPEDPPERLHDLFGRLSRLRDSLNRAGRVFRKVLTEEGAAVDRRLARRVEAALDRLAEAAESLEAVADLLFSDPFARSFHLRGKRWGLSVQPVDVSEAIRRGIFLRWDAVVLTSATLSREGDFSCFRRMTGMDLENGPDPEGTRFRFQQVASPFPADAAQVLVPPGAVSGRYDRKVRWLDAVSSLLPSLIAEHRGRTLVLFASYNDLETVAQRVMPALEALSVPVLLQQRGEPTAGLCEAFRSVAESVLFGVDTFWYGVDFRGDTLTQVVITRIPYPSPFDPLQEARKRIFPAEAYWQRYHYDTAIKLRQGMGRLIRSETDRGRVVILDRRFGVRKG